MLTKWTQNEHRNRRNYTNFENNLAMMVLYLSVKFEFDWKKRFRVSPEMEMLTNGQKTDKLTPISKAT